jgi:amidase
MSSANRPVLEVSQHETFCVETKDCYSDALRSPEDRFTKAMWNTVNPATGPVYFPGAEPGRPLRIEILDIRTRPYAVMCLEQGSGALGGFIEASETTILPIENNLLMLNGALSIPIRPMIGVIGTAPAGTPVLNGTPGEHGGNMDCKLITAGSVLYLPVNTKGALLALGDLHAVMGDGEVCLCGAEVSGEVTLRAAQVDSLIPTPCVETESHFHFIGSAETLDECERMVLEKAHRFLTRVEKLSSNEAARAMSLLGDLGVCQVVDPLKTMRFSVPKTLLNRPVYRSGRPESGNGA